MVTLLLHCALASGTVYCNRSCQCVCVFEAGGWAGGVCEIARIDLHQTGSVGAGNDHLQLIK